MALRTTSVRLLLAALLAALVSAGLLVAPPARAQTDMVSLVNAERTSRGLAPLTAVSDLTSVAQSWSQHMASTGQLAHNPSYSTQIRGWISLAENVGYGADVQTVHRALMNSASHRANILDPSFTQIGIGIAQGGGRVWVTQNFRQPQPGYVVPAAMTASGAQEYVTRVYSDLLARRPDSTGLQTWTSQLTWGTPRVAVANAITSSTEFRTRLIDQSYRTFLGRGADSTGLRTWLALMGRGGTIQQMQAGFISSPEYYQRAGGTDRRWMAKLYVDVLGRTASSREVEGWVASLATGRTRQQVALGFLLSTEHLQSAVDGYYRWLLGRGLDATGRQTWVTAIQRGARDEQIIGGIVSSREYFPGA